MTCTKEFIDKLQQKLRINLEKFQQQNLQLAQANSQMLAFGTNKCGKEAYAFSQGVRLAVKNGWNNVIIEGDAILVVNRLANRTLNKTQDLSTIGLLLNEARSLLKANPSFKVHYVCRETNRVAHTLAQWALSNHNPCGKEVESHKEAGEGKPCNMNRCSKADESHEEDQGEDKPCNMNRKRQSYCLGPSNIQPVQVKEGVENKRVCLRRQSARRKAQEPETTEDTFVVDDSKFLASSTSDDKVLECGPSNIKPFEAKMYESGPCIKPVQSKEGIDNTRACLRRQSARFKAQEPETNKDVFEVDELRFLVSSTSNDQVPDSGQLSSDDSSIKSEHKEGNTTVSSRTEAQELRRVSAGRPLRRAVKKVQSYKEMKLNVKMRIQE
ncbi:hypothetical protein F3Y22_tig00111069pilonHSYRG00029 [Hibiscus syriacus]|uniref:RNase H type-1 domain-containing protein n=1 Tax=Hibiscus syriacus TaxID=106335 RepID=A0A6A2Z411_HIBSY|nr:hypothetical protein F3Y22_tig00111069pilonHSYRG00029 [Hibiscus syriacus]